MENGGEQERRDSCPMRWLPGPSGKLSTGTMLLLRAMTPQAEKAGSRCKGCDPRAKTYAIGGVGTKVRLPGTKN